MANGNQYEQTKYISTETLTNILYIIEERGINFFFDTVAHNIKFKSEDVANIIRELLEYRNNSSNTNINININTDTEESIDINIDTSEDEDEDKDKE